MSAAFYQPYDYVKSLLSGPAVGEHYWAQGTAVHTIQGLLGLFGVLALKDLRHSLLKTWSHRFPGYSIGGLAVGESHEREMNAVLSFNAYAA